MIIKMALRLCVIFSPRKRYLKLIILLIIVIMCFVGVYDITYVFPNSNRTSEAVRLSKAEILPKYKTSEKNRKLQIRGKILENTWSSQQFRDQYELNFRNFKKKSALSQTHAEINGNTSVKSNGKRTSFNNTFKDAYLFRLRKKLSSVNCVDILKGDKSEINKTKENYHSMQNRYYHNISRNCNKFILQRNYITSSLTKEEETFPLAYSLLVFKDAIQVERLLRAIYRPQNVYCIHIDNKSHSEFREMITNIASCFNNVFIATKSINVIWGTLSVLEPELICMNELLKFKKWKYFINLTGQEFPLRTNYELVKILKIYHGANDLEGTIKRANKERWKTAGKPPHGIRPVKGSVHITVNRNYVSYIVTNQTAKDFLQWTRKVDVPDEVYFSSLNHNPQLMIPGTYKGEPESNWKTKPFLTRFKNWGDAWPCHGKRVRVICIFGVEDLPLLAKRPELFANKFHSGYEPLAYDCLEEFHYNRTRDEYLHNFSFNTSFYENVEFIKHVV